jgi:hypothetical protein
VKTLTHDPATACEMQVCLWGNSWTLGCPTTTPPSRRRGRPASNGCPSKHTCNSQVVVGPPPVKVVDSLSEWLEADPCGDGTHLHRMARPHLAICLIVVSTLALRVHAWSSTVCDPGTSPDPSNTTKCCTWSVADAGNSFEIQPPAWHAALVAPAEAIERGPRGCWCVDRRAPQPHRKVFSN